MKNNHKLPKNFIKLYLLLLSSFIWTKSLNATTLNTTNIIESAGLKCTAIGTALQFKCSGGIGKDHFNLTCEPAEFEFGKFACSFSNSNGISVSVICDMLSGTEMPNCSGIDSQGIKHTINCTTNESGASNCSIVSTKYK